MRPLYRALILAVVVWELILAGEAAFGQTSVIEGYPVIESFSPEAWEKSSRAAPKDMEWWQDAKFGLLIQWGPVVLTGKEVSWSHGGVAGRREDLRMGKSFEKRASLPSRHTITFTRDSIRLSSMPTSGSGPLSRLA